MSDPLAPEVVVKRFIQAMNSWELAAWKLSRAARDSANPSLYQSEVMAMQREVFSKHCTQRERLHGREGSFQRPPEYAPERETIIQVDVHGARAHVDTKREAALGGVSHRYVLHRDDGAWLIDSLKRMHNGIWVPTIL
jgi:NTF2 fold immunity protein